MICQENPSCTLFSCDQAAPRALLSVCPPICLSVRLSVCLSHLFHWVPIIVSSWNFQWWLPMTEVMSMQKVKVRGQRSRSQRWKSYIAVSGLQLQFELTYGNEVTHRAWCGLGEVSYCLSRSSVKFKGPTAQSILTQIGRFRTVTGVRIHQRLWNDTQSLK